MTGSSVNSSGSRSVTKLIFTRIDFSPSEGGREQACAPHPRGTPEYRGGGGLEAIERGRSRVHPTALVPREHNDQEPAVDSGRGGRTEIVFQTVTGAGHAYRERRRRCGRVHVFHTRSSRSADLEPVAVLVHQHDRGRAVRAQAR